MGYPAVRLRRTRRTPVLRRMVRETRLSASNLVLPLFVCPGEGVEQPIGSMPGVARQSVDRIVATAAAAFDEGVPAVILFGIPEHKDAVGDRKSTRLNSSHLVISYAVFCLKKKNNTRQTSS